MKASEQIDGMIARLDDWRGATIASLRKIIHAADPQIVEEWKWMGAPVFSDHGIVCVVNAFKDKVKMTFYNGASLPDPDKLFNNGLEGKQWRTIDFHQDDKINEKALIILLRAAVELNKAEKKPAPRKKSAR